MGLNQSVFIVVIKELNEADIVTFVKYVFKNSIITVIMLIIA